MVDLDRLERVLIQAARERRPLTYAEVLGFFDRGVSRGTVTGLCLDLGRIERRRLAEGWPNLACLVVRRSNGLPGVGYFTSLRSEGRYAGPSDGPEAQAIIAARQAEAFAWAARLEGWGEPSPARPAPGQAADLAPAASRSM